MLDIDVAVKFLLPLFPYSIVGPLPVVVKSMTSSGALSLNTVLGSSSSLFSISSRYSIC